MFRYEYDTEDNVNKTFNISITDCTGNIYKASTINYTDTLQITTSYNTYFDKNTQQIYLWNLATDSNALFGDRSYKLLVKS